MNDSIYRVETLPRLAQWRIGNFAPCTYRRSEPFKIGNWNWYLSIEKNRWLYVKLYPKILNKSTDSLPIASFVIRVLSSVGNCKPLYHPGAEIRDKQLKNSDDFVWAIEPLTGKFIIDVEFIDLKISSPEVEGGNTLSIWGNEFPQKLSTTCLSALGRMLSESIHTDITIKTPNGSIKAHRAILASRSLVFKTMFSHDLKEKEMSAIDIRDMSIQECQVFLNYIYGNIQYDEFLMNRIALLKAAEKYDVLDLKEMCRDSLMEDIDAKNVLVRLQSASLYGLPALKTNCLLYLVKFGKVFDIRDDFDSFLRCADRELIGDVFNEVLGVWRCF